MFVFPLDFNMILSSYMIFFLLNGVGSQACLQPTHTLWSGQGGLTCISHSYVFSKLLCNGVFRADSGFSSILTTLKSEGNQSYSLNEVIYKEVYIPNMHWSYNFSAFVLDIGIKVIPGEQVSRNAPHPC